LPPKKAAFVVHFLVYSLEWRLTLSGYNTCIQKGQLLGLLYKMLGTWFTDHKTQATSRSAEVPVGTSSKNPFSADALDLSADETIPNPTALVGTPHDDILAELYGQNAQAERSAARVDAEKSSQVNMSADKNVAAQDSPPPESTVPTVTSASASTSVPISRLYDPFSGAALGVLAAPESDANPFGEASPEDDELWLHMAGILKLQSDIAEMHLQMEDVGAKMGQGARDWEDAGEGGDEDEGMEGDEEVDKKKAREERFARLAGTFTGRREKIDEVMNKACPPCFNPAVFRAQFSPMCSSLVNSLKR
jgi:hypothetical protein